MCGGALGKQVNRPLDPVRAFKCLRFLCSLAVGLLYDGLDGQRYIVHHQWFIVKETDSYSPCSEKNGTANGKLVHAPIRPGNTVLNWQASTPTDEAVSRFEAPKSTVPLRPITHQLSRQSSLISTNHFLSLHVSHSPYRFLVLQPVLQFPTHPYQCFGRIQEAHQERPTSTSPRHRVSILQLSKCHSRCSSAATPRDRSVPKK